MSEKKFKFVSPGIFLKEIDNSQLPAQEGDIGPMVVGLFERGPGLVRERAAAGAFLCSAAVPVVPSELLPGLPAPCRYI